MTFTPVAEIPVDAATCRIYAEGWQPWSPTRVYGLGEQVPFPTDSRVVALGRSLDSWGLEATRRLLSSVPPPVPFGQAQAHPKRRALLVGR
jgi:hypothetical protein